MIEFFNRLQKAPQWVIFCFWILLAAGYIVLGMLKEFIVKKSKSIPVGMLWKDFQEYWESECWLDSDTTITNKKKGES